jgi:2-hydroxy-4-carboxymuconate semialdehyde hemiacetal dehydrogenase
MKVVVAGVGAFGQKHLDALKKIDGVEVVCVVGRQLAPTQEAAT